MPRTGSTERSATCRTARPCPGFDEPPDGADVIVAFYTERAPFEAEIDAVGRAVFPEGGAWIAWPKKASKIPTEVTEDVVRELALPRGLVDNKVCAVDEVWSGLRIVWRVERRSRPLD